MSNTDAASRTQSVHRPSDQADGTRSGRHPDAVVDRGGTGAPDVSRRQRRGTTVGTSHRLSGRSVRVARETSPRCEIAPGRSAWCVGGRWAPSERGGERLSAPTEHGVRHGRSGRLARRARGASRARCPAQTTASTGRPTGAVPRGRPPGRSRVLGGEEVRPAAETRRAGVGGRVSPASGLLSGSHTDRVEVATRWRTRPGGRRTDERGGPTEDAVSDPSNRVEGWTDRSEPGEAYPAGRSPVQIG